MAVEADRDHTGRILVPSEALPIEIRDFITKHIHSVEQIELLALLHREPNCDWSVAALDDIIRSSQDSVRSRLEDLCARGFITCKRDPSETFRYGPASTDVHNAITSLVSVYKNQRIRVIEAIFTKPMTEIRSFSNAFRFRGTKGGNDNG